MADLKFNKATDTQHEETLESHLISASWVAGKAFAGQPAAFRVVTAFVGHGAKIKIKGKSENGKNIGKVTDVIKNNNYMGVFDLPEDMDLDDRIHFEVELPKNGIDGQSETIPVYPAVEVFNLQWSAAEARRGDVLTLSADTSGLRSNQDFTLTIWEFDADGCNDRICELPGMVIDNRIELKWEFEYHEDTDEIATQEELDEYDGKYNPPEYFFTIKIEDAEFGTEQESGIVTFKDWLEIMGEDAYGDPLIDGEYILTLPDGTERKGKLDDKGCARVEDVPPGACYVEFIPPEEEDDSDDQSDSQSEASS